jgi:DNA-binding response OmpR family regulator
MAPELKRLLFVDDESSTTAMFPKIFARAGFSVTIASSVTQALELHVLAGFRGFGHRSSPGE